MTAQEKETGQQSAQAETISQAEKLLRQGKPDRAEAVLQKLLDEKPNHFDTLHLLGVANNHQRKLEKAIGFFKSALKINPQSAQTHYNLGVTFSFLKKYDRAIGNLRQALEIEPDDADAHAALGGVLFAIDEHEEAATSFRRSAELDPDDVLKHLKLSKVLVILERHEEALSSFRRVLEIKPDDAEIHNTIGVTLYNLLRAEEAIQSFRQAVEIKPDHPGAYKNLGGALLLLDRYEEALPNCMRAVELTPDDAVAHINLGKAQNSVGRHEEALSSSRRALEIKHDMAEAHINIGCCLTSIGQPEEGAVAYESALNFCETTEQRAECLCQLSQLPIPPISIDLLESIDEVSESEWGGQDLKSAEHLKNNLRFARAQALDKLGSYREAWLGFVDANSKFNSLYKEEHKLVLKKNEAALKLARGWTFKERKATSIAKDNPLSLFILGPSRSGKSSLEKLVSRLDGVKCGYESSKLGDSIRRASQSTEVSNLGELDQFPNELGQRISELYATDLYKIAGQEEVFTNTNPAHIGDVGWIAESIPSARFIFINRNREDIALRIFMTLYLKHANYYAYNIDKIFNYISWYYQMADVWKNKLPEITMVLSYEEIIANPKNILQNVAQFCGLYPPTDVEPRLAGDSGCSEPYREFLKMARSPA